MYSSLVPRTCPYFLPGFIVETYSSLFLLTFASLIFGSFVLSTFIDLIIILLLLYIHAYNGLQKKTTILFIVNFFVPRVFLILITILKKS